MHEQNHVPISPADGSTVPAGKHIHDNASDPLPPQLQGRLLHIVTGLTQIQGQLDLLVEAAQRSGAQVDTLTRHFTSPDANQSSVERLADLLARVEAAQEQLDEVAATTKKLSRTQFKANTLAESKEEQIATALATLQEILTQRQAAEEQRHVNAQERLETVRAQARADLAAELLPILDGLDLALNSGRSLLAQQGRRRRLALQAAETSSETGEHGSLQRVLQHLRTSLTKTPESPQPPPRRVEVADEEWEARLAAWLDGLDLVHDRFVSVLDSEDIAAIPALHQPFDPKVHVAVSAERRGDVPPGVVVEVVRNGYRQGGRILRFAEVVVSQAQDEQPQGDLNTSNSSYDSE